MRAPVVTPSQEAGRIPSPHPHQQPFPTRAIRPGPLACRLGRVQARDLSGDPRHDLRVTLGSLGHGIALERHADGGIVFLHGTDHLTTCLDIRYGFGGGLVHGPLLLHFYKGPPKIRDVKVHRSQWSTPGLLRSGIASSDTAKRQTLPDVPSTLV